MTTRALRNHVATAIGQSWPAFAASHPALARVVDAELLENYVFDSLADDAAFGAAYRGAIDAHAGPAALATLVNAFVKPLLQRLV